MQQILDLISDDVNKFFCDLNKKENVKNVKLELKGDEGIEFSLEFYDNEASPPKNISVNHSSIALELLSS